MVLNLFWYVVLGFVGLNFFKFKLILEIYNLLVDYGLDYIEVEFNKFIVSCVVVLFFDYLFYIDICLK